MAFGDNYQSQGSGGFGTNFGSSTGRSSGTSGQSTLYPGAAVAYPQLAGGLTSAYAGLGGANRQDWQGLLGGYQALQGQAQGLTDQFGAQERLSLEDLYKQQGGQQIQGAIGRGLSNATVLNSIGTGLTEAYGRNRTNLNEQISRQKIGDLAQFGLPALGAQQAMIGNQSNIGLAGLGALGGLAGQYLGMTGQTVQGNQASQQAATNYQGGYRPGGGGGGGGRAGAMPGTGITRPTNFGGPDPSMATGMDSMQAMRRQGYEQAVAANQNDPWMLQQLAQDYGQEEQQAGEDPELALSRYYMGEQSGP